MLTLDRIYHASYILKNVIRRTDLINAPKINPGSKIFLKPENLQLTGSFKIRGSYYKISQLSDAEKAKGVVACSAGNHAQGVALGATKNGIGSIICLPDCAPISKVEATRSYGAEICMVKGVYDDAYNILAEDIICQPSFDGQTLYDWSTYDPDNDDTWMDYEEGNKLRDDKCRVRVLVDKTKVTDLDNSTQTTN